MAWKITEVPDNEGKGPGCIATIILLIAMVIYFLIEMAKK